MVGPSGFDQSTGTLTEPQSTSGLFGHGFQTTVDGAALAVPAVLMATADPAAATAATAAATVAARTILRVRRDGADRDALSFMPPLKTEDCCGGVCVFRYARDTGDPRHQGTGASRQ
jgi:hypothetical protein